MLGVTGMDPDDDDYWLVGGISYDWPYELEIEAAPVVPPVPATGRYGAALLAFALAAIAWLHARNRATRRAASPT